MSLSCCFNRTLHIKAFQFQCQKIPKKNINLKAEYQVTRDAYIAFEKEWEKKVDYSQLNLQEQIIHSKHKEAIENFHWSYIDPESGNKALTRFRHYLRKTCCGNACRHCIYNHENVNEDIKKTKRFNTAFWVNS